jgi:hypothetical protein
MDGKMFIGLTNLKSVGLESNECIDEVFNDQSEITLLAQAVTDSCNLYEEKSSSCEDAISFITVVFQIKETNYNEKILLQKKKNEAMELQLKISLMENKNRNELMKATLKGYKEKLDQLRTKVEELNSMLSS